MFTSLKAIMTAKNITSKDGTDYKKQCLSLQKQLEKSEEKIKKLENELKTATASLHLFQRIVGACRVVHMEFFEFLRMCHC